MMTTMRLRLTVLLAATTLALLASGCSAPPRNAVPKDLENQASIPGMPDVRFWGDSMSPKVLEGFKASMDRERTASGVASIADLGESHFLALSGGGENGAFGAGLLCGWTERGDRPSFKVVTGISTGALIAPFAFVGPECDPVLKKFYTTITTADIARSRGLIGGLTSDSMADTGPLHKLVAEVVDQKLMDRVAEEFKKGRILLIGTTDMDAQRPVMWSMGRIAASGHPDSLALFRNVMIASAAIPGAFPPVMFKVEADGKTYSEMHSDGGVCSQVFLYPASFSFKDFDKSIADRKRSVYVIRNAQICPNYQAVPKKLLPITARAIDTLIKTQGVGDLYRIYLGCQRDGLDYHMACIPDDFNETSDGAFDPVYMTKLFDRGYAMAKSGYPWQDAPPGFEPPKVVARSR